MNSTWGKGGQLVQNINVPTHSVTYRLTCLNYRKEWDLGGGGASSPEAEARKQSKDLLSQL